MLSAVLSDQVGNVGLVLLCVNYLLLVNYLELELWRMVPVNRQSLKYPINVTFTFSFLFFPKEKGSHGRDSDSVQELKKQIVWDSGG